MLCANCHAENEATARFCKNCGTPLPAVTDAVEAAQGQAPGVLAELAAKADDALGLAELKAAGLGEKEEIVLEEIKRDAVSAAEATADSLMEAAEAKAEDLRKKAESEAETLRSKAESAAEILKDQVEATASNLKEKTEDAREKAEAEAETLRKKAESEAETLRAKAESAAETLREKTEAVEEKAQVAAEALDSKTAVAVAEAENAAEKTVWKMREETAYAAGAAASALESVATVIHPPSCAVCGNPLTTGMAFCNKCGAPASSVQAPVPVEAPAPESARCAVCGNTLKPGAAFCNQCGTTVTTAAPAAAQAGLPYAAVPPPPPPAARARKPLFGSANAPVETDAQKPFYGGPPAAAPIDMPSAAVAPAPVPARCAVCGNTLNPGAAFCNQCGTIISPIPAAVAAGSPYAAATPGIGTQRAASPKKPANKKMLTLIIASVAVVVLAIAGTFGGIAISRKNKYTAAQDLMSSGQFVEARDKFLELADYEDSAQLATECQKNIDFSAAVKLFDAGNYEQALQAFNKLGTFKDSASRAVECQNYIDYGGAEQLYNEGKFYSAYAAYMDLSGFLDSDDRAASCIQEFPGTTTLYKNEDYSGSVQFTITAGSANTIYKLYTSDGVLVRTLAIAADRSLTIYVPSGSYILKEAWGGKWFGEEEMFGDEGYYMVLEVSGSEIFTLSSGYTWTLQPDTDGNADYNTTSRGDF